MLKWQNKITHRQKCQGTQPTSKGFFPEPGCRKESGTSLPALCRQGRQQARARESRSRMETLAGRWSRGAEARAVRSLQMETRCSVTRQAVRWEARTQTPARLSRPLCPPPQKGLIICHTRVFSATLGCRDKHGVRSSTLDYKGQL